MPDEHAVGSVLTHKVGPLPAWGWAVGVGGIGFLFYRYKKGSSPATATPSASVTSTGTPSVGNYGYSSGQNLGGADYAPIDSFLQGLAAQLVNVQNQLGTIQAGQLTTAGPSAGPAPSNPAASTNPIATLTHALGSIFGTPDPTWASGLGEWYISVPDLYGQGQGPPGHSASGAGADEVAAYINGLYPNAHITPTQLAAWNGGQQWYTPGQQLYIGSFKQGVGH